MARLDPNPYPFPDWECYDDIYEGFAAQDAAMQELMAASDALPEGTIKGTVLRFPVADGYAVYVVTKEKPLTIAWVPYLDRWDVQPALIRGLNRNDILDEQDRG